MSISPKESSTTPSLEVVFDISASAARVAASCKASEDIRMYLEGLRVEVNPEGGIFAVGSNGHILGVVHDTSGKALRDITVSISKDVVKRLPERLEYAKNYTRLRFIKIGAISYLELTTKSGETIAMAPSREIEGAYPNWRKVIPNLSELRPADDPVHLPYLTRPSQAFGLSINCIQGKCMQGSKGSAVAVFMADHPDSLFLVMPQRDKDRDGKTQAGWVNLWQTQRDHGLKEDVRNEKEKLRARGEFLTEDPYHVVEA